jgi:hypothetical protein
MLGQILKWTRLLLCQYYIERGLSSKLTILRISQVSHVLLRRVPQLHRVSFPPRDHHQYQHQLPKFKVYHPNKMATNAPTIIDLKASFLRAQILALSQPFRPSADFVASNSSDEDNALRQKNIDDALYKLNGMLKSHNRLAYGPQAQRHVAEQVDKLYWNAGERGVATTGVGEEWAERGSDYSQY